LEGVRLHESVPTGGASPPRDIRQLATKENVGDYIKARQAQEKRHGQ
jgi:hypothetical protein